MDAPDDTAAEQEQLDTDQDRYRNFYEGLQAIIDAAEAPDTPIDRLEATFLANGEITYRWFEARAEEPEGGLIPPLDAS